MKHVLLLVLMLRVWWMPYDSKDPGEGIAVGYTMSSVVVRTEYGGLRTILMDSINNSRWVEVKP